MNRWQLHAVVALIGLPALLQANVVRAQSERPWWIDTEAALGRNDNIGNADRGRDIVDDNFATITLGAGYRWQFGSLHTAKVRAFVETEQTQEVRDLSRYTGGGEVSYRFQINPKPTSFAVQASVTAQADDYQVNQRDSTIITTQLVAIQPIGERVTTSLGAEYKYRDSSGSVWDIDHIRGFLSGQFAFRPTWSVYGTYSYIDGDVASNAQVIFPDGTPADDIFNLVNAAKVIEPDQAFNNKYSGRWLAYRLSAFTNTFKVGLGKSFAHDIDMDVSVMRVLVNAKDDNEYDNWIYRASLLKRF